ncbi:Alpha/Beta hydrolase protein [Obelidium mucronatum]|nr:Alpha/Beta hydrolase protein [Obelidium mucronatum]
MAKETTTLAGLARVSALGCLASSVYLMLIACAELSPLGSPDALVLVTKTTLALPLWIDLLSVLVSFRPVSNYFLSVMLLALSSAALFAFAFGGEAVAASRTLVLVAILASSLARSKSTKPTKVSLLASTLIVLMVMGALIQYQGYIAFYNPHRTMVEIKAADSQYNLHLNCTGPATLQVPTIVFETGLAVPAIAAWASVTPRLQNLRVCVYDRAGYGLSDSGPFPLTAKQSADALYQLLTNANEPGPFILVGHSYGAHIIRLFAHLHPEQVAGLVLLDPSFEYGYDGDDFDVESFHKELSQMAVATSLVASFLSPFAAADRLILPVVEAEHKRSYSSSETARVFKGKFFKAITSELLNFATTSADQVRATMPKTPRTNLPITIISSVEKVLIYCTPNALYTLSSNTAFNEFLYLAGTKPTEICIPKTSTSATSIDSTTILKDAQSHFFGHYKLATHLSEKTRFLFSPGGHYIMFEEGGPDLIVAAIHGVVQEAGKYIRGDYNLDTSMKTSNSKKNDADDVDEDDEDEEY